MMTDNAILKRLHDKGWSGQSIEDRGGDGESALMAALQHPYFIEGTYQDHTLVESLLNHPKLDPSMVDYEGKNAYWYTWDAQHAYPLLASHEVNLNQLDYHLFHFLVKDLFFAKSENRLLDFQKRIELALELGLDPHLRVEGKSFKDHFDGPIRESIERFILMKNDKALLEQLPESPYPKPKKTTL